MGGASKFMKKKGKWLLQYESPNGNKITISVEGAFTLEKIKQITELIELLDPSINSDFSESDIIGTTISQRNENKLKETLILLIQKDFSDRWFGSKDLAEAYYKAFGKNIPTNIISSYLSRLYHSGVLICKGPKIKRVYHISNEIIER